MFTDKGITTEEEDIHEYLGEETAAGAKKVTEQEREELDKDITLEDIQETIKDLKSDKSPGVTGFTNEFYKEFDKDPKLYTLHIPGKYPIIHAKKGGNNLDTKGEKG